MICPVDKSDMIVVEHNQIELDYCTRCHGVWFDAGELGLLLESIGLEDKLFLSNILNATETRSSEVKRRCPICSQKMKKTAIGQKPEILIDACRREHGLWFDGGEVGHLLEQLEKPSGKGSPQQLTGFLREVFKSRE